ncbi:MAG: DUF881 domain-containing protein [Propioniciclava sp.]|uniref:DUF881 domain-containing protein n=1 Tax=Propioniciclava sp. TaxID=2038686 RepID=UPI0039E70794
MGPRERLREAWQAARERRNPLRPLTVLVCVLAGVMMAAGAVASRGNDLRPTRTTELAALVRAESDRADRLASRASGLRAEVDELTRQQADAAGSESAAGLEDAAEAAGAQPVTGPAVSVTLTDAPASVQPAGVDADLLVVHQQDIQAVVNALWAGGAEAMTIQGQRVAARTGIKCVGNTVVIHGVPYAPPYVIVAIGDQASLERSLREDDYLVLYRQYVDAYRLGYEVARRPSVAMPAYSGPAEFVHARAVR